MIGRLLPLALLLAAAAAACAPSRAALVKEPLDPQRRWLSTVNRDHPLVGKIWDVRGRRFVDEPTLVADLARARVVLLGEIHDNPDHHVLQARIVRDLTAAGRRPAVAFEMLTPGQQPEIDAVLHGAAPSADALGKAVGWDQSGWPPFKLYRPIFEAAVDARLPVVGANLPRVKVREIVMKGEAEVPPPVAARIARVGPLSPEDRTSLREEMADSHCGELPDAMLDPMILGQRARDAQMANAVAAAAVRDGAVLVAGGEHVRVDRGVPRYLGDEAGELRSVVFREVAPQRTDPAAYGEDEEHRELPYDYVVFTPGEKRPDPCEQLRARSRSRREQAQPSTPPPPPPATPAPSEPAAPSAPPPAPGGGTAP